MLRITCLPHQSCQFFCGTLKLIWIFQLYSQILQTSRLLKALVHISIAGIGKEEKIIKRKKLLKVHVNFKSILQDSGPHGGQSLLGGAFGVHFMFYRVLMFQLCLGRSCRTSSQGGQWPLRSNWSTHTLWWLSCISDQCYFPLKTGD